MKILVCHNFYQQPGGEDQVFDDECALLESRGHEVVRFTMHNDQLDGMSRVEMVKKTIWNSTVEQDLIALIQRELPDVMHCHNTFPLISPSAYYAAQSQGVAVVQTLHNYRLLCPGATLLRDGKVCEKCIGKRLALPAIRHACYRNNRAATTATTAMLAVHHQKNTWTDVIDRYIALTDFSRQKFIEGGFPAERICLKPNLVQPDPGVGQHDGHYAVFAGRLSPEKGVETLLQTWEHLEAEIPLKILGDGPMAEQVQQAAERDARIEWLGRVDIDEVAHVIGHANVLVMPSVCYETFGRTMIEAFAAGTPVIASRMGAMEELVDEGQTGFLFQPDNAKDLAEKLRQLWQQPDVQQQMRQAAREEYDNQYTAEPNYQRLIEIYEAAMATRGRPASARDLVTV
ncbi:MAG TPA: glycosyltransferase family 1 protein [Planctomycetes bacterium]|nr:glycosyltransferase family 1 protein [Fuerstiella sp.]HIK91407.1 glycosyltransferase family 1 protein [Planctomycetota bacterium]